MSVFWVIYQTFELKLHLKVGLLRSKKILKHFLNNSTTTSTKSR